MSQKQKPLNVVLSDALNSVISHFVSLKPYETELRIHLKPEQYHRLNSHLKMTAYNRYTMLNDTIDYYKDNVRVITKEGADSNSLPTVERKEIKFKVPIHHKQLQASLVVSEETALAHDEASLYMDNTDKQPVKPLVCNTRVLGRLIQYTKSKSKPIEFVSTISQNVLNRLQYEHLNSCQYTNKANIITDKDATLIVPAGALLVTHEQQQIIPDKPPRLSRKYRNRLSYEYLDFYVDMTVSNIIDYKKDKHVQYYSCEIELKPSLRPKYYFDALQEGINLVTKRS